MVKELHEASRLQKTEQAVKIIEGVATFEISMPPQSVAMIEFDL